MDLHQLKTFVVVAREGSVTRASEALHLSQPAVSSHIKAIEEALGLSLFDRTPRGMSLTPQGKRLLEKAERTLLAHQELMDEATRNHAELTGKLRLGAGTNSDNEAVGRLLTVLSERHPGVEVALKHGTSQQILADLRNGTLDGGLYNDPGPPDSDLVAVEVSQFKIHLVAAPGLLSTAPEPDWAAIAELPWIYPTSSACCGKAAEALFKAHRFKPNRIISVDRQEVSRALVASGIGVGLLHTDKALAAQRRGEVEILFEADTVVRVFFAYHESRKHDPMLQAAASILLA